MMYYNLDILSMGLGDLVILQGNRVDRSILYFGCTITLLEQRILTHFKLLNPCSRAPRSQKRFDLRERLFNRVQIRRVLRQ